MRPPEPPTPASSPTSPLEVATPNRLGGWRPGARWAQETGSDAWLERQLARKRAKRAEIQAQIDQLPAHQRPPMRELGRRSEPAPMPFKAMAPDEGGAPARPPYDLAGAFWQQGRVLDRAVVAGMAGRDHGSTHGHLPRSAPSVATARPGETAGGRPAGRTGGQEGSRAPLVTSHRQGQKIVIVAACPAARALGLKPGMAVTQARALVPGLDVRDGDPAADAALLRRLAVFAVRRWSPIVSPAGADGLWIDITGVAHLFGDERRLCARILRFCRRIGIKARIAVAGSGGAADAVARFATEPVTCVPEGGEVAALAPLPLSALRVEAGVVEAASRLGIVRIGDLLAMPRGPLTRRFGATLLARLDQALGARREPVVPILPVTAAQAEVRFLEPIATAEAIGEALAHGMALLTAELAARGCGARSIAMLCRRVDGSDQVATIGTARPTRDTAHLVRLMAMRIERIDPGFGIEAIRLVATRSDRLGAEPVGGLVADHDPDLAPLVDRLVGRLGARHLYRAVLLESDIPERSTRRVEPIAAVPGDRLRWPRPVTLLHRPEAIDRVMSELPDGPPLRFTWRGRAHRVVRGDGPERIYGEWWRRPGEVAAVRDYFQVEDETGARFWLFRRGDGGDGRTGDMSWHLHGVFG